MGAGARHIVRRAVVTLIATLVAASHARAQSDQRRVTQIAEGVHVIQHRSTIFEGGNTTVIIGDRDVLVVDATQLPYAAREDIAEIRRLTSKPVRYLVNTHWHNDHVMGNGEYLKAFPGVAIIAHAETRKDMDLNIPKAPTRSAKPYADRVAATQRQLQSGTDAEGRTLTPAARAALEALLRLQQQAAQDYAALPYQPPTLSFESGIVLDLGGREVHVRHLGRGNTNGDAVVHLPREGIAISGDLLVRPLPFPYDGYPTEWVRTLERLAALAPRVIVPGHGDVMRDLSYLELVRELFASAIAQVDARLHVIGPAEFRTVEEVLGHVDLSPFRRRFAGDDAALGRQFDETATLVVRLVFKEAALR
ncbi:MAG TPA: MBL fold metallo-hydrolase [Gemmatimonadaceae bacterium]|nr:MBL fold metallo-hydrolase [Gemmatimonadaceae bacterium]